MEWWKIFIIVISILGASAYPIYYGIREAIENKRNKNREIEEEDFEQQLAEDENLEKLYKEWDTYLDIEEKAWFYKQDKKVDIKDRCVEYVDLLYFESNFFGLEDYFENYENEDELMDIVDEISDFYIEEYTDLAMDERDSLLEYLCKVDDEEGYYAIGCFLEYLDNMYEMVKERFYKRILSELIQDVENGKDINSDSYNRESEISQIRRKAKRFADQMADKIDKGYDPKEDLANKYNSQWQDEMYDVISKLIDDDMYDEYIQGQCGYNNLRIDGKK